MTSWADDHHQVPLLDPGDEDQPGGPLGVLIGALCGFALGILVGLVIASVVFTAAVPR